MPSPVELDPASIELDPRAISAAPPAAPSPVELDPGSIELSPDSLQTAAPTPRATSQTPGMQGLPTPGPAGARPSDAFVQESPAGILPGNPRSRWQSTGEANGAPAPRGSIAVSSAIPAAPARIPGTERTGLPAAGQIPRPDVSDMEAERLSRSIPRAGSGAAFPDFSPINPGAVMEIGQGLSGLVPGPAGPLASPKGEQARTLDQVPPAAVIPAQPIDWKQKARAGSEVLAGTLDIANSPAGMALLGAPGAGQLLKAWAKGGAVQIGTEKLLEAGGTDPAYAQLFGQLAGLGTGAHEILKGAFDRGMEAHNLTAHTLVENERAAGLRNERTVASLQGQSYPADVNGKTYNVEFTGAVRGGQGIWSVKDGDQTLYTGSGTDVGTWLHKQQAKPGMTFGEGSPHSTAEREWSVALAVQEQAGRLKVIRANERAWQQYEQTGEAPLGSESAGIKPQPAVPAGLPGRMAPPEMRVEALRNAIADQRSIYEDEWNALAKDIGEPRVQQLRTRLEVMAGVAEGEPVEAPENPSPAPAAGEPQPFFRPGRGRLSQRLNPEAFGVTGNTPETGAETETSTSAGSPTEQPPAASGAPTETPRPQTHVAPEHYSKGDAFDTPIGKVEVTGAPGSRVYWKLDGASQPSLPVAEFQQKIGHVPATDAAAQPAATQPPATPATTPPPTTPPPAAPQNEKQPETETAPVPYSPATWRETVQAHGRWEQVLLQALAHGDQETAAQAARMVDKYAPAVRAGLGNAPGTPVTSEEIRDDWERGYLKPAQTAAAPPAPETETSTSGEEGAEGEIELDPDLVAEGVADLQQSLGTEQHGQPAVTPETFHKLPQIAGPITPGDWIQWWDDRDGWQQGHVMDRIDKPFTSVGGSAFPAGSYHVSTQSGGNTIPPDQAQKIAPPNDGHWYSWPSHGTSPAAPYTGGLPFRSEHTSPELTEQLSQLIEAKPELLQPSGGTAGRFGITAPDGSELDISTYAPHPGKPQHWLTPTQHLEDQLGIPYDQQQGKVLRIVGYTAPSENGHPGYGYMGSTIPKTKADKTIKAILKAALNTQPPETETSTSASAAKPEKSGPLPSGTWMNDYDIHIAKQHNQNNPVVLRAIQFLERLIEETDAHSDGWAHWKLPSHAARQLMGIIQHPEYATEQNFRRALAPIRSFYTKRGTAAGMQFPSVEEAPETETSTSAPGSQNEPAPHTQTLAEYRQRPEALQVPTGSVLAVDPDKETAESLQRYSKKHLQILAMVSATSQSGSKPEIAARVVQTWGIRKELANETVESLEQKPGAELRRYLDTLDLFKGANKHAQAVAIINWRNQARHKGQQAIAEGNWLSAIHKAVVRGESIPENVIQDLRSRGKEWVLEKEEAEPSRQPEAETKQPELDLPTVMRRLADSVRALEQAAAAGDFRNTDLAAHRAAMKDGDKLLDRLGKKAPTELFGLVHDVNRYLRLAARAPEAETYPYAAEPEDHTLDARRALFEVEADLRQARESAAEVKEEALDDEPPTKPLSIGRSEAEYRQDLAEYDRRHAAWEQLEKLADKYGLTFHFDEEKARQFAIHELGFEEGEEIPAHVLADDRRQQAWDHDRRLVDLLPKAIAEWRGWLQEQAGPLFVAQRPAPKAAPETETSTSAAPLKPGDPAPDSGAPEARLPEHMEKLVEENRAQQWKYAEPVQYWHQDASGPRAGIKDYYPGKVIGTHQWFVVLEMDSGKHVGPAAKGRDVVNVRGDLSEALQRWGVDKEAHGPLHGGVVVYTPAFDVERPAAAASSAPGALQWTSPENIPDRTPTSKWDDPEAYYLDTRFQQASAKRLIESEPQRLREVSGKRGAADKRHQINNETNAARGAYTAGYQEVTNALGKPAAQQLRAEVEKHAPGRVPPESLYPTFWNSLYAEDQIAAPQGTLTVTRVEAMTMQTVMPTGRAWVPFGRGSREVYEIEATLPDGTTRKFREADLRKYLYGQEETETKKPEAETSTSAEPSPAPSPQPPAPASGASSAWRELYDNFRRVGATEAEARKLTERKLGPEPKAAQPAPTNAPAPNPQPPAPEFRDIRPGRFETGDQVIFQTQSMPGAKAGKITGRNPNNTYTVESSTSTYNDVPSFTMGIEPMDGDQVIYSTTKGREEGRVSGYVDSHSAFSGQDWYSVKVVPAGKKRAIEIRLDAIKKIRQKAKTQQTVAETQQSAGAAERVPKWGNLSEYEAEVLRNLGENPDYPHTPTGSQPKSLEHNQKLGEAARNLEKHGLIRKVSASGGYIRTPEGTIAVGAGAPENYRPQTVDDFRIGERVRYTGPDYPNALRTGQEYEVGFVGGGRLTLQDPQTHARPGVPYASPTEVEKIPAKPKTAPPTQAEWDAPENVLQREIESHERNVADLTRALHLPDLRPADRIRVEREIEIERAAVADAKRRLAALPSTPQNTGANILRATSDRIINEIHALENAVKGTPHNAGLVIESLEKMLPPAREYLEKLPAPEPEKKALRSTIAAAEAAIRDARKQTTPSYRPQPGDRVQINAHTGMGGRPEDFGVVDNISTNGRTALVKLDTGGERQVPIQDVSLSTRPKPEAAAEPDVVWDASDLLGQQNPAVQAAIAGIRNLDRPEPAERTAVMDALVKAKGNASEQHGIKFGMWPSWAAKEAEQLIAAAKAAEPSETYQRFVSLVKDIAAKQEFAYAATRPGVNSRHNQEFPIRDLRELVEIGKAEIESEPDADENARDALRSAVMQAEQFIAEWERQGTPAEDTEPELDPDLVAEGVADLQQALGEEPTPPTAPAGPRSYRYELKVHGEGDKYHALGLRFATPEEAEKAGSAHFSRWMMAEGYRVAPSDEEPNYRWDNEKYDAVHLPETATPETETSTSATPAAAPQPQPPKAETPEERLKREGDEARAWLKQNLGDKPQFEREAGPHGPVTREFYHDAKGAIAWLKQHHGEAVAALYHPEIGDIDLIWGYPGTLEKNFDDGYGLSHIIAKRDHLGQTGIVDNLQEILARLPVRQRTQNRIQLWDKEHRAAVRLDWDGQAKRWLLTLFKLDEPSSPERTTGVSGTPLTERGGTPPPEGEPESTIAPDDDENKPAFERGTPPDHRTLDGRLESLGINREVLKRLNRIGAEHAVVNKLTSYPEWAERMNQDLGEAPEPVRRDSILRMVYGYVEAIARQFHVTVRPAPPRAPQPPKPAPPSGTNLIPEADQLIASFRRIIRDGSWTINDNPALVEHVKQVTGRSPADGSIDTKQIYDLLETAWNQEIAQEGGGMMSPDADALDVLSDLRAIIEHLPTQSIRSQEQTKFQQFSTPPPEAFVAARVLAPTENDLVMETSAGNGGLAAFARAAGARVLVNEIDPRRAELLRRSGYRKVAQTDAEQIDNLYDEIWPDEEDPTAVLMNPPFSAAGERGVSNSNEIGYRHVLQALQRLQAGGRLVAILGGGRAGWTQGTTLDAPGAQPFWRKIRDLGCTVRANVGVNGKEYAKYGTTFGTRLVVIDKVAAPTGVPQSPVQGDFETLEDVWHALEPISRDRQHPSRNGLGTPAPDHAAGAGQQPQPGTRGGVREPGGEPGAGVRGGSGSGGRSDAPGEPGTGHGRPAEGESQPGSQRPTAGDRGDGSLDPAGLAASQNNSAPVAVQEQLAEAGEDIGDYVAYKAPVPPEWGAHPHPAVIVETQTMAAVREPAVTIKPQVPQSVIDSADLSDVQLAAIAHTLQAHQHFLSAPLDEHGKPTGEPARRLGFFLGDGTGTGKGRTIAGTAVHYWNTLPEGKRRFVWISFNEELSDAARKDLDKVGGQDIPIYSLDKVKPGKKLAFKDGILFVPYSKLAVQQVTKADGSPMPKGADKAEKGKGQKVMRRLAQIEDWAGEEPLIVMDECVPAGTLIETPDGPVAIEKLRVGDLVLGWNHETGAMEATPVLHTFRHHTMAPLVQVNDTLMTGNHPVWTEGRGYVPAYDIRAIDAVATLRAELSGDDVRPLQVVPPAVQLAPRRAAGDRGVEVFNIETGTANYFANRLLVHNCHKAKNATATQEQISEKRTGKKKAARTGLAAIRLQNEVPKARMLYSSATGFSDVSNMAYANRLGIWGPGTSFKDFQDFAQQVRQGGIGMMEFVARDLKAQGKYLSRFLSYDGVHFRPPEDSTHEITPEQHALLDRAGDAWRMVMDNFRQAAETTTANTGDDGPDAQTLRDVKSKAMSQLWGMELRFYRTLYTAMKVPTLIKIMDEALSDTDANGKPKAPQAVVISVLETGKAQQDREVERMIRAGEDDLEGADLSPMASLIDMVDKNFPTLEYETVKDPETGEEHTQIKYITDANGVRKPMQNRAALDAKKKLLAELEKLKGEFPDAALDQIINRYGVANVAEMTKRDKRFVRNEETGKRELQSRGSDLTKVNLQEMKAFQNGDKYIAIISNAASTGISLHSSIEEKNQRQRLHILLQLKWSADMTMQDLGRTHRTAQAIPPEYVLLCLNVEGEKRFAATIARRLEQLGALSRGERKAGGAGTDFSQFNFESVYGRMAVDHVIDTLFLGNDKFGVLTDAYLKEHYPSLMNGRQILSLMGLHNEDEGDDEDESSPDVPVNRFFNRLMMLPVNLQNELFRCFMDVMNRMIENAKRMGTFDWGAEQIHATHLTQDGAPLVVYEDPITGAQAVYYRLKALNPRYRYEWQRMRQEVLDNHQRLMRVKASGRLLGVDLEGYNETQAESGKQRTRLSATAASGNMQHLYKDELSGANSKYEPVPMNASAEREWNQQYEAAGPWVTTYNHIITGSVLPIWSRIQEQRGSGKEAYAVPLKVRIGKLDNKGRVIGAEVEAHRIRKVLQGLGHAPVVTPEEAMRKVLGGKKLELNHGGTLKRAKVSGEYRLELEGAAHFQRLFPQWGLFQENVGGKDRWFIPTGERALGVFTRVLKELPARGGESETEETETPDTPEYERATGAKPFSPVESRPPSSDAEAIGHLQFWLTHIEASLAQVDAGQGTTHDIRVLHQGPIIAVRLGNWLETHDDARWEREQSGVDKVSHEALMHSLHGTRFSRPDAEGHANHYRPYVAELQQRLANYEAGHGFVENAPAPDWKATARRQNEEAYAEYVRLQQAADAAWEKAEAGLSQTRLQRPTFSSALEPADIGTYQRGVAAEEALAAAYERWKSQYLAPLEKARQRILEFANAAKGRRRRFTDVDRAMVFLRAHYAPESDKPEYERAAPGFYSQLQRVIETKMPAKASVAQTIAIVKNPANGVKADELTWSGFEAWAMKQQGPITRQAALDYLKANQIEVREVAKGGDQAADRELRHLEARMRELEQEYNDLNESIPDGPTNEELGEVAGWTPESEEPFERIREERARIRAQMDKLNSAQPTKFGQYTLPGGENYRELLLTLPARLSRRVTWSGPEVHGRVEEWTASDGATIRTDPKRGFVINGHLVQNGAQPTLAEAQRYYQFQKDHYELEFRSRREALGNYKSAHWSEPNVVAHVRFDDRTGPHGEKILQVEEIQSDWHQEGRKHGYRQNQIAADAPLQAVEQDNGWWEVQTADGRFVTNVTGVADADAAVAEARRRLAEEPGRTANNGGVPAAPFAKTWHELAFRRMLRWAAENGYDKIAWTTGAQQADRYDLSKQVDSIHYIDHHDGTYDVWAANADGGSISDELEKNGITPSEVEHFVGKEIAQKIVDGKGKLTGDPYDEKRLTGVDLKVGGEGMQGFYDKILPAYAAKLGKKFGAEVGSTRIDTDAGEPVALDVVGGNGTWNVYRAGDRETPIQSFSSFHDANYFAEHEYGTEKVHALPITDAMRASVMQGQPLFERALNAPYLLPSPEKAEYRNGVVWLNRAAMNALAGVWGETNIHGMKLEPKHAAKAIEILRHSAPEVAAALEQAAREHRRVVVTNYERPLHRVIEGVRHEWWHAFAAEIKHPLGAYAEAFLAHPLAQQAAAVLTEAGYSPKEIASEIGAHLAAGQFQQLGLTRDEAKELAFLYFSLVAQVHGAAKLQQGLSRVAPMVIEALREKGTRRQTADDTGRGTPRPGDGRERGPAGTRGAEGPQSLRSGLRPDLPALERSAAETAPKKRVGERGAINAPILTALPQWLASQFGANQVEKVNYSGLGAARTRYVPGGGLGQIERADPEVFMRAVGAGSSRAKATTIVRFAVTAMRRALEGSGITYEDLITAYLESEQRGARDRWDSFADQVMRMSDVDLHDAFDVHFLRLLDAIKDKAGLPHNLAQTAATFITSGTQRIDPRQTNIEPATVQRYYQDLRDFLHHTFGEARDRVQPMMDAARFSHIEHAIRYNPQVRKAHVIYKRNVEQVMAENHALNDGVFSNALGPLDTYYPRITPEHETPPPYGKAKPYRKPGNPSNRFATGLAPTYDPSPAAFQEKLAKTLRANDKAALIDVMRASGMAQKATPGQNTIVYRGVEYPGVIETARPERSIFRDGKWFTIPEERVIIPRWAHKELAPILTGMPMDPDTVRRIISKLNLIALRGPAEFLWHSAGLVGAMVSNTPWLGDSFVDKLLSSTFLIKRFAAIFKILAEDPTDAESMDALKEMAAAGAIPAKSGKITFSKQYAAETGAKLDRGSLGPLLYGPKGFDTRARVAMWRIAKAANPGITPRELYHFVNQLGNYTPEFQSTIEQAIKGWGLGPFATAGSTRVVNGIHAWTGAGPLPKDSWSLRLWQLLTVGGPAMLAMWALLYRELCGTWPWQDRRAKLFQFPVGSGKGWIDQYRHSWLGDRLWGKGAEVGYLGLSFFNPNLQRAAQFVGLAGAFQTHQMGGNTVQMIEASLRDVLNAIAHPTIGPAARAVFTGTSGRELYLTGLRDRQGQPGPEFMPAIPKKLKPGFIGGLAPSLSSGTPRAHAGFAAEAGARTARTFGELNAFASSVGESTGFLGPDKGTKGDSWLRMLIDLCAPGLVKNATNPWRGHTALARQRHAVGE
jgi:hypothetical protein